MAAGPVLETNPTNVAKLLAAADTWLLPQPKAVAMGGAGALGFATTFEMGGALFLSAGGYHHHLGLNTWESKGGSPPPPGTTGLFHTAIRYPDRRTLADAVRRVMDAGIPLTGASDHGVSEAIYLNDPDSNGVELYRDRPQQEWPRTEDGAFTMFTKPLDVAGLLAELDA